MIPFFFTSPIEQDDAHEAEDVQLLVEQEQRRAARRNPANGSAVRIVNGWP